MRLLFSFLTIGVASPPACRMTQPASDPSNSSVNSRGNGVGVDSGVEVGSGVSVTGTNVGDGEAGRVGNKEGAGVAVAGWQAVMKSRHPMSSVFMALLKHNCLELCSRQLCL